MNYLLGSTLCILLTALVSTQAQAQWLKISNTDPKPARYVVRIVAFYADGSVSFGSGALIGPRHVLTAGHILYNHAKKNPNPVAVMVTPGMLPGGGTPFGSANALKWAVANEFKEWKDLFLGKPVLDYGVILLNKNLGAVTGGWFEFEDWPRGWEYQANISGYIPEHQQGQVWQINANLKVVEHIAKPRILFQNAVWNFVEPLGGVSGGPLWLRRGDRYKIIGIYTRGASFWSTVIGLPSVMGMKVHPQMRGFIDDWKKRNP